MFKACLTENDRGTQGFCKENIVLKNVSYPFERNFSRVPILFVKVILFRGKDRDPMILQEAYPFVRLV